MPLALDGHDAPRDGSATFDQYNIPSCPVSGVHLNLPNSTNVQFKYNSDRLRVQKISAGGTVTNYILDGLQALLEKGGTGTTQTQYVLGLARIVSGTAKYYLEDRLGSIIGLTDANQNITYALRYDSYGNLLQQQGTTSTAYLWIGHEAYYFNSDVLLYVLGMRHYNPALGRFLTRDLLGYMSDENVYRYVRNRPTEIIDPSGLIVLNPFTLCVLGALGFGIGSLIGSVISPPQAATSDELGCKIFLSALFNAILGCVAGAIGAQAFIKLLESLGYTAATATWVQAFAEAGVGGTLASFGPSALANKICEQIDFGHCYGSSTTQSSGYQTTVQDVVTRP
jgi:RHS repeat-associated protein